MATEDGDAAARQNRLEHMRSEFRTAQERRVVKRGIVLWNQTETSYAVAPHATKPTAAKDESS